VTRAVVIHASHLLERGFETAAPDRVVSEDGAPTWALFAALRAVLTGLSFKEPEVAVAVLDADVDLDAYPPALRWQAEQLEALLGAHGIATVTAPEARHVVASYVARALEDGHDVVVVGSDKRLAQLVSDEVWWYDAYKDVRYTPDIVRQRFEVGPASVADWLALVGDDDGLPGVKGLGKKGAADLIRAHGSIREALARRGDVPGRAGKALRAAAEVIPAELERAHLQRDRPLPMPLAPFRPPGDREALQALYRHLGFVQLLDDGGPALEVPVLVEPDALTAALAAFGERRVSLQAVTGDPSPVRGSFVGLALAATGGPAFYVPAAAVEHLRDWLEDAEASKLGHDVKAAQVALRRRCGISVRGIVGDSGCAAHLHEPSGWAPQDLPLLARHVLGRALPEEDALRGKGKRRRAFERLAAEKVAAFAGTWAEAAAAVFDALEPTTDRALLDEYLALSEMLVEVELTGIAVDREELARAGADFEAWMEGLEEEVHALAGHPFNLNSTKQLGAVLYEELGLPVVKRTKTGWSTATDALERLAEHHPLVPKVIRWRMLRRLRDSWVTALAATIEEDGRVRSTFSPARSFSGRFVNANPDLGRVPGRTEEMDRIRRAFVAPPGRRLLSVDYQQLGLYVLAHLTEDPALVEPLTTKADLHRLTAAAIFEKAPEDVTYDERQRGKVTNFATFAGQGASALAAQLGVEAKEAKAYLARFDRRYAKVRAFQDEQLRLARERGYIVTLAGRRWPIGGLSSPDAMMLQYAERLAQRATHEASVADVSRRGMLRAYRALKDAGLDAMPLLQILDEVLFEVAEDQVEEAAAVAAEAMRTAFDLRVPLEVGCEVGTSWDALTPL
jgi:DNA polymerase-1